MSKAKQRDILKNKSEKLKDALTGNISEIKEHSKEIVTGSLIGGALLLGGYIIYRFLSSDEPEHEPDSSEKIIVIKSPEESPLIKSIKASIATFILAIAKQKILEYIESNNSENAKNE